MEYIILTPRSRMLFLRWLRYFLASVFLYFVAKKNKNLALRHTMSEISPYLLAKARQSRLLATQTGFIKVTV